MARDPFNQGLYTPLLVPSRSWDDISMDFIVAPPRTSEGKDAIMVVVGWFSKMAHLIACHKCDDNIYIADLLFQKIVRFSGAPRPTVSNRDTKILPMLLFNPI